MNTSDAKIIWMGGRTSGGGAQQHFDFFSFYHFSFFLTFAVTQVVHKLSFYSELSCQTVYVIYYNIILQ